MKSTVRMLASLVALVVLANQQAGAASGQPIVKTLPSGQTLFKDTVGYKFTVGPKALSVSSIGVAVGSGLFSQNTVGLWNEQGSLLANAFIPNDSTPEAGTIWSDLPVSVMLLPNETYTVGACGSGGLGEYRYSGPMELSGDVSLVGFVRNDQWGVFSRPTKSLSPSQGAVGANLRYSVAGPTDSDNDGVNDYREGKDGTDPNNPSSFNPLSKGLVAYYPLNRTLSDESGNGNDIIAATAGIAFGEGPHGAIDSAITVSTKSDTASSSRPLGITGNQQHTFAFWMFLPAPSFPKWSGGEGTLLTIGSAGVGELSQIFADDHPDGGGRMVAHGSYSDMELRSLGNSFLGSWQYVIYIYNGSVTESQIYLNGRKTSLIPWPGGNRTNIKNLISTPLFIGATKAGPLAAPGAKLSEVRVYNRALQASEAAQLYKAESKSVDMVAVKGGTLPQGSELAGLKVEDFRIGKYEVTWGEWKAVRDWAVTNGYTDLANVGAGSGDEHPVRNVSWYHVVKWCNAKSQMEGLAPVYEVDGAVYKTGIATPSPKVSADGYRLPTEAEWEWAARGGASGKGFIYSGGNDVDAVAWYSDNSAGGTKAVGTKAANELGINDMSGNVYEWCYDLASGSKRRVRGGRWNGPAVYCSVANRAAFNDPDYLFPDLGLRIARSGADFPPVDNDKDGVNDYREGKDGTDPNNVSSFNPLSKGLVAYYPFDGNAKDESGNGRNATVSGGAVLSSDRWGAPSAAYSFDGIDDVIQRDGALVDCSTATGITFSGWVYYASAPAGAPFVSSQNVATYSGWGIWNYQGRISGLSGRKYVAPLMQIDANKIASSGQWYHVVLASEFGNPTSRLYVDGALQKESRQPVVNDVLLDRLAIGKWLGTETHLKGKCDAVRVYDRALSATEVAQLYKAESQNPNMIAVKGGTLPQESELAGQKVEDFRIGKYEVTWGEWKTVRDWGVANGYTDLANVGAGSGDNHPVRNVSWYDVVKWCNAKSQMEGLVPVYKFNGGVYKAGQSIPAIDPSADGYRLPLEKEWEWAARGGILSKGFSYSGSNSPDEVAWHPGNSLGAEVDLDRGAGTWPVGLKMPNELGIYDMSGNVWEWCRDKTYDVANGIDAFMLKGGCWSATYGLYTLSGGFVSNPLSKTDAAGFRLARNAVSFDTTAPAVNITSIAANARLTSATATFAGAVTEAVSKPTLQYRLGTNGVWSNSVVSGTASPYSFSQSITLKPGPNAVQFQAQDSAGNKSAIAAVNVSYVVPATLNVAVPNAADGSISSGFGGNTSREVGVTYTITATPASGMVFKEWLKNGTSFSANAALTFKMEAGLKLTPVFVPDFAKLGGVYNGLVGTGDIGTGSAADRQAFAANNGFILINTAANGALSGVLRIQGGNHPFTGTMGANKKATLTIARPGKAVATAALNLTTALPGEISGTVTAGGAAIPFRALRGGHTASTGTHALGGRRYGIVLPPPAGIALGYGYGTLTVDNDGSAVLAARLPTGQAINAGARIVDDGKGNWVFPVYAGASGIFTGEIVIPKTAPSTGSELGGSLEWLKTPGSSGPAKDGFLKALQPLGARHNVAAAGLGGAAFTLHLDPARRILSAPVLQAGQWGNGAAPGLAAPVRSALNVGFNPLSGEFRGSFTRSKNGVPAITPFQGGLFSRPLTIPGGTALRGAGFFNDGSSSAAVEVRSP